MSRATASAAIAESWMFRQGQAERPEAKSMPVPKLPLQLTGLLYPYHHLWWRRTLRRRSVLTPWNQEHQAIFVHIPKTAGTSVLAALGAPAVFDTHAPARSYRAAYPDFFARAYKFAFVRNPWDRFASSFHFMKTGTDWPMQQQWAQRTIGDMDFRAFTLRLKEPLFRATVLSERFFWPQTFWLGGANGGLVDEIFRFEALDDAMARLCARFGLPQPAVTPHLRKVEKPDFRALFDAETAAIVGRLYRRDVAALGYSFEKSGAATGA
jgi:chondroitin 4-sulfotransferase 11